MKIPSKPTVVLALSVFAAGAPARAEVVESSAATIRAASRQSRRGSTPSSGTNCCV